MHSEIFLFIFLRRGSALFTIARKLGYYSELREIFVYGSHSVIIHYIYELSNYCNGCANSWTLYCTRGSLHIKQWTLSMFHREIPSPNLITASGSFIVIKISITLLSCHLSAPSPLQPFFLLYTCHVFLSRCAPRKKIYATRIAIIYSWKARLIGWLIVSSRP